MAFPTFEQFTRELHGREPFPWQSRLADRVHASGWPNAIAVPTGMGKTSCIDIAVWALAAQADRPPSQRTAPTRIWYVVNRRLLVDAAADHADRLRHSLMEARPKSAVGAVSRSLRSLHAGDPLWVTRMRGGIDGGWIRPKTPAQPAVLCATVPMFGSRLLFRGYGIGSGMWPVDAALAGTDAVVLLDESHLSPALLTLLSQIRECDGTHSGVLRWPGRERTAPGPALLPEPRDHVTLVELSATTAAKKPFTLDHQDRSHPVIAKRLRAAKHTAVIEVDASKLTRTLVDETLARLCALDATGVALVFVNQPRIAREVASLLPSDRLDVVVLTGQLRELEADRVRRELLDPSTGAPAGRPTVARARPLVIVATQTLEVGADLDVDVLVTQAASVRSLTQRFGRLNRLGDRPWATAAIVGVADADPVYGDEPRRVLARLDPVVDLNPAAIARVLGEPEDRVEYVPELLPHHLWEFAKTSPPPPGAAPPELFFSGLEDPDRTVTVAWRGDLPAVGERLDPPLHVAETVDVSIAEVRDFIKALPQVLRLSRDGATVEPVTADSLRVGDRVVLHSEAGGYAPHGWDPAATDPVRDLSPQLRQVVFLTAAALRAAAVDPCAPLPEAVVEVLDHLVEQRDDEPASLTTSVLPPPLEQWLVDEGILGSEVAEARTYTLKLDDSRHGVAVLEWRTPAALPEEPHLDVLDELSALDLVPLAEHLLHVGQTAEGIARHLGLPSDIVQAVAQAGEFHDLGKADRRFQRWLGNSEGAPIAKSRANASHWERARAASGWPRGGRHELLSAQLIDAAVRTGVKLADDDLVRHLVLTHHGHGRPWVPSAGANQPLRTCLTIQGRDVEAQCDPGGNLSDQPSRFRVLCERYGYWGLALLEAVVRQADHLVSRATEVL